MTAANKQLLSRLFSVFGEVVIFAAPHLMILDER
jgi:hypothetical protein